MIYQLERSTAWIFFFPFTYKELLSEIEIELLSIDLGNVKVLVLNDLVIFEQLDLFVKVSSILFLE